MRRRAPLAVALIALGLAAGPAAARMSILYDTADVIEAIVGADPDGVATGLGVADGLWQQQPAPLILPGSRHAWKVSGGAGSSATPTLAGRSAESMASLLRDRIRRAGGHLVFLDELTTAFRDSSGVAFREAMDRLAAEQSPWGGGSLARRVHVYVPTGSLPGLIGDPAAWADAWRALALAGGVWVQTYRSPIPPTPWPEEEWLAFPRGMAEGFAAAGGAPERLHLLLTTGDQARQWLLARTGPACGLLANGPGAYRLGADAPGFVAEFRATFGPAPAPATGPSPIECAPPLTYDPAPSAALAGVLGLTASGGPAPARGVAPTALIAGRATGVSVRLGPDPLGIAARLGADPATFWAQAAGALTARGAGAGATGRLAADGSVTLRLSATEPGPIALTLTVGGGAVRAALGGPADLVASAESVAPVPPAARLLVLSRPTSWRLSIPVASSLAARVAPGPPASRVALALAGAGTTRRLKVDPRRGVVAVARVLTAGGAALPGRRLVARLPNGRGLRVTTDVAGSAYLAVPRRAGRLVVALVGTRLRAERRIAGPPPLRRTAGAAARR